MYERRPDPKVTAWRVDGTQEQALQMGHMMQETGGFMVIGRNGWIFGRVGDWVVLEDGEFPIVMTDKMFNHQFRPATPAQERPT